MNRFFAPALVLLCSCAPAPGAPQQGQLDGSEALFSVLAAINAAGYDADLDSSSNHPLREAVRREVAAANPPVLPELKRFFAAHRQPNPTAELSQYISFALTLKDPPEFEFRYRMLDLPPDVVPLQELRPLLKRFYKEAAVATLWNKAQPSFDEVIARYHEAAARAVLEVSSYLRHPTGGYLGRRFQIYVDLLGAPNQIHLRSFADDFFLVLTPSLEPHYGDVRRAYLQYLLDPMVVKYGMELLKKKSLIDYALGAPALDGMYKEDFPLLATKCLVKAVEARLERRRGPELVGQALREGYILTPHFYEQLSVYEKQEQAMKIYVAEMISSIDLNKEVQRLDKVEFAQSVQVRKARTVERPKPVLSGAAKTIEDAENLYAERKLDPAREAFTRVLKETEDRQFHARAYYGLGRIAILQRDPGLSEKLLQKALELSPDPYVKGWVLVYLGRLADAAGERERAEKSYQEALQVSGASLAAHQAAEKGIRETFKK